MIPSAIPSGALLIDKPADITSFGVLERIKAALKVGYGLKKNRDLPKVGHGGTLDPFATGLLVVLVGNGSKLADYFLKSEKHYAGAILFGKTTDSGDPTGKVIETSDQIPESAASIREAASTFVSQPYEQIPPMYSAKKMAGKRLYELAREGIEVERKPKQVRIHEFSIPSYDAPLATIEVACSSGTYIRTLAQDLGRRLRTVAMLSSLRRTRSGSFFLESAIELKQFERLLTEDHTPLESLRGWIGFDSLLIGHPKAECTDHEARDLSQGRQSVLVGILARSRLLDSDARIAGLYLRNQLVAVAKKQPSSSGQSMIWGIDRVFPLS